MHAVAKIVHLKGPGSVVEAAEARIAALEARIAAAESGIKASGAAHEEHLSVTTDHADRIGKLEAAHAAAEAAKNRPGWLRRLFRRSRPALPPPASEQ